MVPAETTFTDRHQAPPPLTIAPLRRGQNVCGAGGLLHVGRLQDCCTRNNPAQGPKARDPDAAAVGERVWTGGGSPGVASDMLLHRISQHIIELGGSSAARQGM